MIQAQGMLPQAPLSRTPVRMPYLLWGFPVPDMKRFYMLRQKERSLITRRVLANKNGQHNWLSIVARNHFCTLRLDAGLSAFFQLLGQTWKEQYHLRITWVICVMQLLLRVMSLVLTLELCFMVTHHGQIVDDFKLHASISGKLLALPLSCTGTAEANPS